MNSVKTLVFMGVLGVIAYGAYVTLTRSPETADSTTLGDGWGEAPKVEIPGPGAAEPQFGGGLQVGGGMAPAYAPAAAGGEAPRLGFSTRSAQPESVAPMDTSSSASRGEAPPLAYAGAPDAYGQAPAYGGAGATEGPYPQQAQGPYASSAPSDGLSGAATNSQNQGGLADASSNQGHRPYPQRGPRDAQTDQVSMSAGQEPYPPYSSNADPPSPAPAVAAEGPAEDEMRRKFESFMTEVQQKLDEGRLAEAHLALSSLHDNPDLPVEYAQKVTDVLDQLAGTVIYSPQHLLEPPYQVRQGDTLESIAQAHNIPWPLVANINGIRVSRLEQVRDPRFLQPGRELKVVRGPFTAVVDLDRYELTLLLDGRYAGRFPIGLGEDYDIREGAYVVSNQTVNPEYYGPDRTRVDADDPNNPYGELWIGLGNEAGESLSIGLHGTNDPRNLHQTGGRGSIRLGERDIEDVFGILSIGSRVVIQR